MAVKPITPDEIPDEPKVEVPEQVIEVFNELIRKHRIGSASWFEEGEVLDAIREKGLTQVVDLVVRSWEDVLKIYRDVGWIANYNYHSWDRISLATFYFDKRK